VVAIVATGRWPNLREAATLVTATVNLGLVVTLLGRVRGGDTLVYRLADLGSGLGLSFRADALALIFALVASGLWLVNSVYAIGYMRGLNEHAQTRFFASFAVAIAAAMVVAFAGNLFTLFVGYELLTFSTYALVIHHEDKEALAGGRRYLTILLGTSVLFQLPAIVMIWAATGGRIEFGDGPLLSAASASPAYLTAAFVLFIAGIGKGALMPLHGWLPAAMVAPTPVSAFLHAVAVVKAGVFCIATVVLRVYGPALCHSLSLDLGLTVVACITVVTASWVALRQDNLKRRLAYSTVSQLSYIILGVALCTRLGMTGGLFHIGAHAVSKITLFFCAGAIYVAHHKTLVSQLDGMGRRMPITMAAFAVGSISMIGVPPTSGVISKIYLAIGSLEWQWWGVLVVLVASTILNACYFLPIVTRAFLRKPPAGEEGRQEAPLPMVAALSLTAVGVLVLFFCPDLLLGLAERALPKP
jgi:multicomponent Na+:H+ antiporter subunit D